MRPARLLEAADLTPALFNHAPCKECDNFLPWLPVIDGHILPASPVETIRQGTHYKVPTIISTMRNETLAFVPTMIEKLGDNEKTYEALMSLVYKSRAGMIKKHYSLVINAMKMTNLLDPFLFIT